MSDAPGFDFDEEGARKIVDLLQTSANLMNESVAYAESHYTEAAVRPFKRYVAQILADLGWDVLEQGFYKRYPQLRPAESELSVPRQ